jgi:predicted metalloprotease
MPRRLLGALCALLLASTIASPAVAAPVVSGDAGSIAGVRVHFQDDATGGEAATDQWVDDGSGDQALADDQFSAFEMPGLTSDNLTDMVLGDIDAYWSTALGAEGFDYYAAGVTPVTDVVQSGCGQFGAYDNPAAFCPVDDTVYVSVPLAQQIQSDVGDFAWITVLAHEWGHHVQTVLGIQQELSINRELQADCFAGTYAQRAKQQGFLQEGDVSEAVLITMLSADPIEMPESADGAHGSADYRVTAFMQGYLNGAATCLSGYSG